MDEKLHRYDMNFFEMHVLKYELRVTSCQLRVVSCELQDASW